MNFNKIFSIFMLTALVLALGSSSSYAVTDKSLTVLKQGSIDYLVNNTWINDWDFQLLYSEIYKNATFFTIEPIAVPPFSGNVTGQVYCNGGANVLNVNFNPSLESVHHIEDFMLNEAVDITETSLGEKHFNWNCEFNPTGTYDWWFGYQIVAYSTIVDTASVEVTYFDTITQNYSNIFSSFTNFFTYITNFIAIIYLMFEFFILTFVIFGAMPFMFYIGSRHIKKLTKEIYDRGG